MATLNEPVGYECEFIDQVPEDYLCELCKHVAREPTIITCCGETYCKACIGVAIRDKRLCPSCKKTDFSYFPHAKYHAKILALNVSCLMKDRGCKWTGQLHHLDAHLNVATGNCIYVDVDCPSDCNQKIQKRNVKTHLAHDCPNRDYVCPCCSFRATFREVSEHLKSCHGYPLVCPNSCGATFKTCELEDHMKICGLQKVYCELSYAGCQAEFVRDKQKEHMEQNIQKHLALMAAATFVISQEQQQTFEQIQQQQQRFEQIFERKLLAQQQKFEQKLQEKDAEIEALKDKIKPYGEATLLQPAVSGSSYNPQHYLGTQLASAASISTSNPQGSAASGNPQCYVGSSASSTSSSQYYAAGSSCYSPQHFTTDSNSYNFVGKKLGYAASVISKKTDYTLSNEAMETVKCDIDRSPLCVRPGGYQIRIKPWPNGMKRGRGTHVSVRVNLIKGDYDKVILPVRKFTVTIELLNQHQDQDHYSRDIRCEVRQRKVMRGRVGQDDTFIAHTELGWNSDKSTLYLKDNCLKFRLKEICFH